MNCLKNPRLKVREQVAYAGRALELNMEHMAVMLYCLNAEFPDVFSKQKCKEFFIEYGNTVTQYDDEEERDYMIERALKEMPYLTWAKVETVIKAFGSRAEGKTDKAIYHNEGFLPLFALNLMMMLIQLHYDHHYGQSRIGRLINAMLAARLDKPLEWLKTIGIEIAIDDDSGYELIQKIGKKNKHVSTVREQLDARKNLQALKAYQDGITGGREGV